MSYQQTTPLEPLTFTITFEGWWRHPTQFSIKCHALDEAIEAFMAEHAKDASSISEVCYYRPNGQAHRFSRLEIDVALEDWYHAQPLEQSA